MNNFYPFIHERKKKDWEPLPLYIEPAPLPKHKEIDKDKEEKKPIIIELFLDIS